MSVENMTDSELETKMLALRAEAQANRVARLAVSKEISFRGSLKAKAKALEALAGMTPEEIERVKKLTQTVGADGVKSEEKFGDVG